MFTCVIVCVHVCAWAGITLWSHFSPSPVTWVPGDSGYRACVVRAFTYWAVSLDRQTALNQDVYNEMCTWSLLSVHYFTWEGNFIIVFSIFFCDYLGKKALKTDLVSVGRHSSILTSFSIKLKPMSLKRILVVKMLPFTPCYRRLTFCSVLFSSFFSFLCFLITSIEIKTSPTAR